MKHLKSIALCLPIALLAFLAGGASAGDDDGVPSVCWSFEFEPVCYEFDVDGAKYQRTVRPTLTAPEGMGYTEALIYALTLYQVPFGPFGNQGEVPGLVDPCAFPSLSPRSTRAFPAVR